MLSIPKWHHDATASAANIALSLSQKSNNLPLALLQLQGLRCLMHIASHAQSHHYQRRCHCLKRLQANLNVHQGNLIGNCSDRSLVHFHDKFLLTMLCPAARALGCLACHGLLAVSWLSLIYSLQYMFCKIRLQCPGQRSMCTENWSLQLLNAALSF